MYIQKYLPQICFAVLLIFSAVSFVNAQTTAFTYQGRLNDAMPSGSSYLFKFELFGQSTNGTAIDTISDVPASETYIFAVRAKRILFSPPAQIRLINEDANDINFVGINQNLLN